MFRPIRLWIQSLDEMRALEPEYLIPSHTRPVVGREKVSEQLTIYRDGIQWVYVATVRVSERREGVHALRLGGHLDDLVLHTIRVGRV
jgi:alkyl sulfatase BDS1-like metallo-beta-lactamase superfamily hydrolase